MSKPTTLITTYLQMTHPDQFKPAFHPTPDFSISKIDRLDPDYYLFLYRAVGYEWGWRDRFLMTSDALIAILSDAGREIYVAYADGVPAGYIELEKVGNEVEIAFFGLRRLFIGRGMGKHVLSFGIERAWELAGDGGRVWLHTCNLDSEMALPNYIARGFMVYQTEEEPMPEAYVTDLE
ncbi:MAG: GNAT family N-acetyltransferase [Phototrophicales bacterium]|nr:GNAT family N-acetyltransferase [Phototrophicales bacterium]